MTAPYCPRHEYEGAECCSCCIGWRQELRRVDNALRAYWRFEGLSFKVRGRSVSHPPCGVHGAIAVRGQESQYAAAT